MSRSNDPRDNAHLPINMHDPNFEQITQMNALNSPLLRLPAEVRLIVYDYTCIGRSVHVGEVNDLLPKKYLHGIERLSQADALLRTCIQIRHEARPAFYRYCTFDFRGVSHWPNLPIMSMNASITKDIQLIAISESTARTLQGIEASGIHQSAIPNYQAAKYWIGTLTSLRRVAVVEGIMFLIDMFNPVATAKVSVAYLTTKM